MPAFMSMSVALGTIASFEVTVAAMLMMAMMMMTLMKMMVIMTIVMPMPVIAVMAIIWRSEQFLIASP